MLSRLVPMGQCGTPGCAESLFECVYKIFRKLAGIKGYPVNGCNEKNR